MEGNVEGRKIPSAELTIGKVNLEVVETIGRVNKKCVEVNNKVKRNNYELIGDNESNYLLSS
jgi:hypothetical protein